MRQAQEREFHSFDQVPLFYRYWPSTTATTPAKAIVLLHRGHEHSGRVTHLVDELDLPDTAFFAWDARGNGRSPGTRGDAPGFPALVRDLDSFIAHISAEHGIAVEDIVVIAQSVGAVVAATWVHDYAPRLRALVMASPAFKVKLYVPFARAGLALMQKLRGNFFVNSYVKPQWLTHDPARVESYRTDPLITRPISVRVLLGLYEAADRIVADAQAISVPVQLLVSGSDFVVHRGPQDRFYERLSSPIKERVHLPGFFPAGTDLFELFADAAQMGQRAFDRRAVVAQMGATLVGDGIEPLVALGDRGHVVRLFEEGQRRIDDAGARAVHARGLLLDRLDQIVAVARLLLDEIERDQAEVARGEHAADPDVVAEPAPVAPIAPAAASAAWTSGTTRAGAPAAAAAHRFEFAPHPVLRPVQAVMRPVERIIMGMHFGFSDIS